MTTKMNVSTGSPMSEDARPKAGTPDIVSDVKDIAGEAAGQAKEIANHQITVRKDKALDTLGNVAQALRETSGRLGTQKETAATDYVLRAADGVDKVAQYLRSRDLSRVVRDVESFARREPAIFLGGAFVAGLIGSRFLKSSGTHPQDSRDGERAASGGAGGAQTGPRTATGGAWPREGGSGTRSRNEGLASPLQSGPSDTRTNLSQSRSNLGVGGSSSFGATSGGSGAGSGTPGGSATPGGSGQPIINQTDVTSTQPKTPARTPGYGPPQGGQAAAGTAQGTAPQDAGRGAPQGKP